MARYPNFFIIGAPKCGTTALATWLGQHPNVFISNPKEPNFYSTDLNITDRRNRRYYESLFANVDSSKIAVGEASTLYLYSNCAVLNILKDVPKAKFIVMLRNPVEMAVSFYYELRYWGVETAPSFAEAWQLQDLRRRGKKIPWLCTEPKRLLYGEVCKLGTQLARVLSIVPRSQVLTILYDDFKVQPAQVWSEVLNFLEVPYYEKRNFEVINSAKKHAKPLIWSLIMTTAALRRKLRIPPPGNIGTKIIAFLNQKRVSIQKEQLSKELHQNLAAYFREDVILLSELLNKDLTGWLCWKDNDDNGQSWQKQSNS